ncbi:TPA: hypothetical protein P5N18_003071, partial [Legionella pneumophila]|nr:hypothetical protein [Legionella pneumophila]
KYTDSSNFASDASTTSTGEESSKYLIENIENLNNKFEKFSKVFSQLVRDSTDKISKIEVEQRNTQDLIDELRRDKHNLIEVMGIFVGIFTFLSIEIQILKTVTDFLRIAGLSIITFSGITFFLITLFIFGERWINKETNFVGLKRFYFISIIALLVGISLVAVGDYNNPAAIKNEQNFVKLKQVVEENKTLLSELQSNINSLNIKIDENLNRKKKIRFPIKYFLFIFLT